MLQKKGKKPIGFGAIVYPSREFIQTRGKRKSTNGSKIYYEAYHCQADALVIVVGFKSNNGEKYFKVVPLRLQYSGSNNRYINWDNISIINAKFILESERQITKSFANEHQLKNTNYEANRRFGKEFT